MASTALTHNISAKKAIGLYDRATKIAAKYREKAADTTQKVVRTTEIGAMALGMGIIQGSKGSVEFVGVPLELGLGVALNLAGYFGVAGKHSDHLCNFGDGALASYLTTVGKGVGAAMKAKAAGQAQGPAKGRSALSADEIAAAVNG